jgi:alpha-L-fucosidase 2
MKSLRLLVICTSLVCTHVAGATTASDMLLWYRQPAKTWLEAMPMGNGLMGAMVFGGVEKERIALNEGTFWSGRPHDYDDPDALKYFSQIRDLVFAGKFQEAEKMIDEHFYGRPAAQQAFQPLGDLNLTFGGVDNPTDYRRELDMESGVAKITFHAGDALITREVFVSYPDKVMVVHIGSDKPGRISVQPEFKGPYLDSVKAMPSPQAGMLYMDGQWKGPIPVRNPLIAPVDGKGLRYRVVLAALTEGGTMEVESGESLRISKADSVTFVVAAATSYVNYHDISGDPAVACEKVLTNCQGKDYATLRRRHVEDFSALMGRVHLNIGETAKSEKPTDERLRAFRQDHSDSNLQALAFQFGRYLLASSSRAGGQPANLQGIWDENVSPSWGSKYTININTEMNYWPAEVCNLSECHQPLFDMLRDISETGAKTARTYYGVGGWVAHHNIDLWRGTAPVDAAKFGMWPVGGAWLCQDIWEHYLFTGDREFLKTYYPIMKGDAQFLSEVLVEEPKHHWLVTPFSMSPEHGYYDGDGKLCFVSPGPTLDIALMRELFSHCIEAQKLLEVDHDFGDKLEAVLKRLPPYRTNQRGFVQEWIEDWKPGNQGHNVSPDFPMFPGSTVTLRGTPDLAAAELKWMSSRRPRGGWPTAWDICMWARLEKGDRVQQWMDTFTANSFADNLQNRGANQSDANFGFTAGVAECLLQSHAAEINLLPALPPSWPDGSATGLRARGGFTVDMQWKDGKLLTATIHSSRSAACRLRCGEKSASAVLAAGAAAKVGADLATLP